MQIFKKKFFKKNLMDNAGPALLGDVRIYHLPEIQFF